MSLPPCGAVGHVQLGLSGFLGRSSVLPPSCSGPGAAEGACEAWCGCACQGPELRVSQPVGAELRTSRGCSLKLPSSWGRPGPSRGPENVQTVTQQARWGQDSTCLTGFMTLVWLVREFTSEELWNDQSQLHGCDLGRPTGPRFWFNVLLPYWAS